MKYKQPRLGFELRSSIAFPRMITVTLCAHFSMKTMAIFFSSFVVLGKKKFIKEHFSCVFTFEIYFAFSENAWYLR